MNMTCQQRSLSKSLGVQKIKHDFVGKQSLGVQKSGFTLIELIVAIAIFSLVAVATNQVLQSVSASSELSDSELSDLQSLQRAMLVIERDFQQIVDRIPRLQGQENNLMIDGGEFEFESDADGVGFVRNGWHNPQLILARSTLQNVVYRVKENQLQRLHTNYVDSVVGTEPKVRVLLENIEDLQIEMLREVSATEAFEWSETIESTELPRAVKVTINSSKYGLIERVFQVSL